MLNVLPVEKALTISERLAYYSCEFCLNGDEKLKEIETKTPTQSKYIASSINIDLLFRYFVTRKVSSFYCMSETIM